MNQIKYFYVGIKGLILRKDGKMLLLKPKRDQHKLFIGDWDIPGGRILSQSEGEHRLRNKIKEETGLIDISSIKPFGSGIISDVIFQDGDASVGLILMVYLCKLGLKDVKVKIDDSHSEFKWFTPKEAAANLYQFPDDFREKLAEFKS